MIKKKVPYTLLTATALATLLSSTVFAAKGDFYYGDASDLTRVQKSEVKDKKDILKANKDKLYYQIDDTNIVKYSDYISKIVSSWATGSSIGNAVTAANGDETVRAGSDIVEKAAQVDAGLIVSSVSVVNKTAVQVVLKDIPTGAPTADKFVVKVGDSVVPVTKVTAKTGTSTTFTLDVALDGKEGKVNVNGTDSAAFDYKAPTVAKITPLSNKILDITFSEDVNAGLAGVISNYVMAQTGTANVVNMSGTTVDVKDSKTVRLTLASALIKDVDYTVTVKNMQDAAKNVMAADGSSSSFKAIVDTTKPTIASAVGKDANKVEVTMSEEMDPNAIITASIKPYNTDGTLGSEIANTVQVSGNKATINITDASHYLTNGQKYKITLTGGLDLSGNAIADSQSVDVTGVSDNIAPTVVGVPTYDSSTGKLTIKFSEPMDEVRLAENDNYAVFETNTGISATISQVISSEDKTSVDLTFTGGLSANTQYSVRLAGYSQSNVNGLRDAAIIPNALLNNTVVKFTTPAVVIPVQLNSASTDGLTDGKSVKLKFNDDANIVKEEAENIANYTITSVSDSTKTLAVTKAVYDDSTKSVTLTTAPQEQGAANYKVTVSGLTNLKADNSTATFNGVDKVAPVFTSATARSSKVIDLAFDSEIQNAPSVSTVSIVEKGTANVVTTTDAGIVKQANKKTARLTLNSGTLVAGKTYVVTVTGMQDMYANISEAKTLEFTFSSEDTQAPTLQNVVAKNGASIDLYFNEEVSIQGTLDNNNFVIKKGTESVTVNTLQASQDDDKTKVTLKNVDGLGNPATIFENGASYTVTVKNNGDTNYVKDIAGNKVTETSYSFTGVVDTTKPQLVSASMADADNKVVLTFSEPIQTIPAGNEGSFVVTDATTGEPKAVTNVVNGTTENPSDAIKVTLTLRDKTEAGKQYRVYISTPSIIRDNEVTPNTLDTSKAVALFNGGDLTPPEANINAILTDANTLVLAFSEKLDPTSVGKSDFVINDGSTITVTDAKVGTGDEADKVTLTLAGNDDTGLAQPTVAIAAGQYIADLAGNKLGSSTDAITLELDEGDYVDKAIPSIVSAQVVAGSGMKIVGTDGIYTATKVSDAAVGDLTLKFTENIDPSTLKLTVYDSNGVKNLDDNTLTNIKNVLINENEGVAKSFTKNIASSYDDVKTLMNTTAGGTTVTKIVFTYKDVTGNQSSFQLNIN